MADPPTWSHAAGTESRREFRHRLDDANDTLLAAALRIVEAMPDYIDRFLAGDDDVVAEARAEAELVSQRCDEVEREGFVLIAREAPVGRDLRQIVALLRLVTDVDRSAQLLRHVPELLLVFEPGALPEDLRDLLAQLAEHSRDVFRAGVDAWRRLDPEGWSEVEERDEAVDRLRQQLILRASTAEVLPEARVALGLASRYLERIADHGVVLARDAAFVATGQRPGSA